MAKMKLIVGLGNPGSKYVGTRHNVGFEVLAHVGREIGETKPKGKFQGEIVEGSVDGERVILLSPCTYMNHSGASVQLARDFYKLDNADLLVICDDFNLPTAKLRFRAKGSSGGQKGLQDVIRRLGTDQFARLRLGIGPPPAGWDVADFVLSKFSKPERQEIESAIERSAAASLAWVRQGIEFCMNQYNAN